MQSIIFSPKVELCFRQVSKSGFSFESFSRVKVLNNTELGNFIAYTDLKHRNFVVINQSVHKCSEASKHFLDLFDGYGARVIREYHFAQLSAL